MLLRLQDGNLKQIFGSMMNQKLLDFEDEAKGMGDNLTDATIDLYKAIVIKFLPTPAKIHYLFNLRDISKVKCTYTYALKMTRFGISSGAFRFIKGSFDQTSCIMIPEIECFACGYTRLSACSRIV